MTIKPSCFVFLVLLGLASSQSLPRFNAKLSETTVSGLSSGAYMAVQMHVAFSSTIKGAAVFAGGPYDCAEGSEITALTTCMSADLGPPNPSTYALTTDVRAAAKQIDDPKNMANSKVYIYTGTLDSTVSPKVVTSLYQYYLNYIPASNINFVNNITSAHTQPTDNVLDTNPCWLSVSPYLSDCQYDGAGEAFGTILGSLKPRNTGVLTGQFISFDQSLYLPAGVTPSEVSLASQGYAYVPAACESANATCKIHVTFHGCAQSFSQIGFPYIQTAGYNQWADTNNIVVLYPQTVASTLLPSNPQGCWDWWGYAGSDYDVQAGPQMQFAMNIMKATTSS